MAFCIGNFTTSMSLFKIIYITFINALLLLQNKQKKNHADNNNMI